jgi:hypothetical protein
LRSSKASNLSKVEFGRGQSGRIMQIGWRMTKLTP